MEKPLRKKRDSVRLDIQLDLKSVVFVPSKDDKAVGPVYKIALEYSAEQPGIISVFSLVSETTDPIYHITQK